MSANEFALGEKEFRFLVALVGERTGIVLSDNKRSMVYSRLARRLRQLGMSRFDSYCHLLESEDGQAEIAHLVNAITTNLTHFFRENHHFDHLRDTVITPMLSQPPPGKRLRIWSAGCSSGAEPYSIAMVLHQALGGARDWDARILATDIDTTMLAKGEAGLYSSEMCEKIPEPYRRYVADHSSGEKLMKPELKAYIAFKPLNLLDSWPMRQQFDAVFCRNVVIYFDKDTQRTLFHRMADVVKLDGLLYIGHSESLYNLCDRFQLEGRTVYRRVR